ncbi:unnamed protein product [Lampetra planeri]
MATLEKGSETPLAEQRDDHLRDSSPPAGREHCTFRARLAEHLKTVATVVTELDRPWRASGGGESTRAARVESSVAVFHHRESSMAQPTHAATILFVERDGEPANSERPPSVPVEIPSLR